MFKFMVPLTLCLASSLSTNAQDNFYDLINASSKIIGEVPNGALSYYLCGETPGCKHRVLEEMKEETILAEIRKGQENFARHEEDFNTHFRNLSKNAVLVGNQAREIGNTSTEGSRFRAFYNLAAKQIEQSALDRRVFIDTALNELNPTVDKLGYYSSLKELAAKIKSYDEMLASQTLGSARDILTVQRNSELKELLGKIGSKISELRADIARGLLAEDIRFALEISGVYKFFDLQSCGDSSSIIAAFSKVTVLKRKPKNFDWITPLSLIEDAELLKAALDGKDGKTPLKFICNKRPMNILVWGAKYEPETNTVYNHYSPSSSSQFGYSAGTQSLDSANSVIEFLRMKLLEK